MSTNTSRFQQLLMFAILALIAATTIYPVLFIFNTALKTDLDFALSRFSPAFPPTLENLISAWNRMKAPRGALNSFIVTIGGVIGAWLICCPAAYAATKMRFPGRDALFLLLLATLVIPVQTILYSFYVVMGKIGILDTHLGMIVAFTTFAIPITTFQLAAYFKGIPDEIVDAARVDGASTLQILWLVIIPIARPALAVTGIINFIWMWNDILLPVLILQSPQNRTLMVLVGLLRGQWGGSATLIASGISIAILPVLIVFVLAQRQIIQGMTVGSVK